MNRKPSTRGFTLAELLIVVAVIAVLVAIAIPVFNSQLEKSREATDLANVRSAYAEVMTAAITEDRSAAYNGRVMYDASTGLYTAVVSPLAQKQSKWQSSVPITIGGVSSGADGGSNGLGTWNGDPQPGGSCTIICGHDGAVIINWGDGDSSGNSGNTGDSSKITDVPSQLPSGQNFHVTEGNIYRYNGNYYVAGTNGSYNSYYFPKPGNTDSSWLYIPIDKNATVRTAPEYDNVVTNLKAGDIYKLGNDYYVMKTGATHQNIPPGGNWIKINY